MTKTRYVAGRLKIEEVDAAQLATQVETPFYVYSSASIEESYHKLVAAVNHPRVKIFFAVKSNSNLSVIKLLAALGAGMDIVSSGEMKRCLKAGVAGKDMVFSGVGKTTAEIKAALEAGVHQFNIESIPEIHAIAAVAEKLAKRANVCLRINPDIDAKTHAKTATAKKENKFGINWDDVIESYQIIAASPHLAAKGLSMHIGSQVTEFEPFRDAFLRMEEMVKRLRAKNLPLERVSLGGGIGIQYRDKVVELEAIGRLIHDTAERLGCDIELEPGRCLVGEAGVLISKVIYVKHSGEKNFLIIDAAMNDLIRPTLYEAYHPIDRVEKKAGTQTETYDVVGPVCETGDYLALDRELPQCQAGDVLAIFCAGAYGATMASCYNSRDLIAEILVRGATFDVVRPRLTIEQQMTWETIPPWISA